MNNFAETFVNERSYTLSTFHNLQFLDVTKLDSKLCEKIFMKTCMGKSSLLYKIMFKKIILTEEERQNIKTVMSAVFDKIEHSYKNYNILSSFLVSNQIKLIDKKMYDTLIFDIFAESPKVLQEYTFPVGNFKYLKRLANFVYPDNNNDKFDDKYDDYYDYFNTTKEDRETRKSHTDDLDTDSSDSEIIINTKKNQENVNLNTFNNLCRYGTINDIKLYYNKIAAVGIYPNSSSFDDVKHNRYLDRDDGVDLVTHFLINGYKPDITVIEIISKKYPELVEMMLQTIDFKKNDFHKVAKLCGILTYLYKYDFSSEDFKYLLTNYIPTQTNGTNGTNGNEEIILTILNKYNITDPNKYLHIVCYHKCSLLAAKLVELGAHVDKDCAIIACSKYIDENMLIFLVNNKIFVDKNCFKNYINTIDKYTSPEEYDSSILKLVSFGLVLDLDCVEFALLNNRCINNLDDYGIEYDEDLYEICAKNNIFPKTYYDKFVINIGKEKIMLREMFKSSDPAKIEKFMKLYKVEPDKFCFKNALDSNPYCIEIISKFNYSPVFDDIIEIKSYENRKRMYEMYYKACPITF